MTRAALLDASSSIYARSGPTAPRSQNARNERRRRVHDRLALAQRARPDLRFERAAPMRELLSSLRLGLVDVDALAAYVDRVGAEVEDLEHWAQTRPAKDREDGASVRLALELLKGFAELGILSFVGVAEEDRSLLVRWLGLEHRWCYAAAGTDRKCFKRVTGRTGAR